MGHIFLYLIASYALMAVVGVIWFARSTRHREPELEPVKVRLAHSYRAVCWICLGALLPIIPYAVVEVQTRLYLPSLRSSVVRAVQELNGDPAYRSAKVLGITPHAFRVYVVTPCPEDSAMGSGWRAEVLRLSRSGPAWKLTDFEAIWSDCGSASGNVFPPYPAKGDYP